VVLEPVGSEPIILDLGTGLRPFGCSWPSGETFRGTALVSHLHWDHVQGLPFFAPMIAAGSRLDVFGPTQDDGRTLCEAIDDFMCPPYFPITLGQLPAEITVQQCPSEPFKVGTARVIAREVPHIGATLGFRVEADGVVVAYIPDHQQPLDGSDTVDPAVLELCRDADVIIHDAQFTDAEFAQRSTWGHCTIGYAVHVAIQSGARRLALFHHDPGHTDDQMDLLLADAVRAGRKGGIEVFAAAEGLRVDVPSARYARVS
jgi:phosphoribosyl 1,2-cyclic phosphodiesterase